MESLNLSGSGADIFSVSASAQQSDLFPTGFSVLVEGGDGDLFGDASGAEELFGEEDDALFFSSLDMTPGDNDTSTAASMASSEEDESSRKQGTKRERGTPLVVDGRRVVLSKETELTVPSVEDFDEYVELLDKSRTLSKKERADLNKQRRRIGNRLYAVNKRQKEKKSSSKIQEENNRLKEENQRLKVEVAQLRAALAAQSAFSVPGYGKMGLLALAITFSIFFSPSLIAGPPGGGSDFGTGRSLMSLKAMAGQGLIARSWEMLMYFLHYLASVWSGGEGSCGRFDQNRILYRMCHISSNSTREAEILGTLATEFVSDMVMRKYEIAM